MLRLRPISLRDANEYVRQHHRHHKPVAGHKFSIGCEADGELVGVIIAGRPVSRYLDDGFTLEVTRLCTNGEKNACSFLYGAAARAAAAMGYKRIITYTLESETVQASGFRLDLSRQSGRASLDGQASTKGGSISRTNEAAL